MFSDSPVEVVGYNHTETHTKGKTESACQFIGLFVEDKSCDTINVKTVATQTDEIGNIEFGNIDFVALNGCLKRCLQFLKTEHSSWPKMNHYFETTDKEIIDDKIIKLSLKQNPSFETKKISVLSWNCCGDKLVIATGEHYHTQWCNHLNSVFVYTMSNLEKGENTVFNKLEVTSCVTCLATHPFKEHLITAGLYNGELLICDLNDMNMVSLEWHSEEVTESLWFIQSNKRVILTTAGKDGYVCVGTMVGDKIKLTQRICRYLVGVSGKIGIRCFDYSERHFLVALENGKITSYLCSKTRNIKDDQTIEAVKVNEYSGNSVMIENVKICPINRNKFVTTQFDCTIILYDVYNKDPIKIIFNSKLITRLCWSLNDEYIVYIGEENGGLSKVNLRNGTVNLVKIISSCSLISININPIRKNVIAMGTIQGEIYLSKYEL